MIKECAFQFKKLTNYHFKIVVSKNSLYKNITINFCESDFVHIAGIHKLKDKNHLIRGSKTNVFNLILTDDKLCKSLQNSYYLNDILLRLELCNNLKSILNKKIEIYSYHKNASNFSKIEADYVIRFYYKRQQCYLFLVKRDTTYHVCNSLICDKRNMVLFNNQYKIHKQELQLNINRVKQLDVERKQNV